MSKGGFNVDPGVRQAPNLMGPSGVGGAGSGGGGGGIGDLLKGIGSIFDGLAERNQERQNKAFMSEVENMKVAASEVLMDTSNATKGPVEVDPETKKVGDSVVTLAEAYRQGKVSATQYYGRMVNNLRDIRQRNPGAEAIFTQYVTRSLGFNPWEKYQDAIFKDQEQAQKKIDADQKKWEETKKEAADFGIGPEVSSKGDTDPSARRQIESMVLRRRADNANQESARKQHEATQREQEATKREAFELASQEIDKEVNNIFSTAFAVNGLTYKQFEENIQRASSDGVISPDEQRVILQQLNQLEQGIKTRVFERLNTPWGDDKRSWATRIGDKSKIDGLTQRAMERWDVVKQAVVNKDVGVLAWNKAYLEAIESGDKIAMMQHSDIFRKLHIMAPETRNHWLTSKGNYAEFQDAISKFTLGKIGVSVSGDGQPLGQVLKDNQGSDPRRNASVAQQSLQASVEVLKNPKADVKTIANTVQSLFGEKNMNFLSDFDEKSKRRVFNTMVSPEVTQRMVELGKTNPQLLRQYQQWSVSTAMNLTRNAFNQLRSHIAEDGGILDFRKGVNQAFPITFDGTNFVMTQNRANQEQMDREAMQGSALSRLGRGLGTFGQSWAASNTQEALEQINETLRVMRPIYEAAKLPPNQLLDDLFKGMNFDASQRDMLTAAAMAYKQSNVSAEANQTAQVSEKNQGVQEAANTQTAAAQPSPENAPAPQQANPSQTLAKLTPDQEARVNRYEEDARQVEASNPEAARQFRVMAERIRNGQSPYLSAEEMSQTKSGETAKASNSRTPTIDWLSETAVSAWRKTQEAAGRGIDWIRNNELRMMEEDAQRIERTDPERAQRIRERAMVFRNEAGMPQVEFPEEQTNLRRQDGSVNVSNEQALSNPAINTAKDSGEAANRSTAQPAQDRASQVLRGELRDPEIENLLREAQDRPGSLGAAFAERQLEVYRSTKEAMVQEGGYNQAIRYRPSQRVRQAFRSIDISKLPTNVRGLLDAIAAPESAGDYNRMNRDQRTPKPLTSMTIGEVLEMQQQMISSGRAYKGGPSTAAGRYQIINATLRGLVTELGLDRNTLFNEETQDKLALRLAQKRGLDRFMRGQMDEDTFINNLAREWAGLPATTGRSFYDNDGVNKSGVDIKKWRQFISRLRGQAQGQNQ